MKNQLKAQLNLVPALRAYVNFFTLILKDYVHFNTFVKQLDNLTLEDFEEFYLTLYDRLYIKAFINGTFDKQKAIEMIKDISNIFNEDNNESINKKAKNYQNLHSDLTGYYIYREKLNKAYNVNHAVLNFYQIGKENINNIINANLIKYLCGYIYFTQLRIKEQLGYTARAKVFSEGNVIYYMIVVQGSKKTPDYMDERIENIIKLMKKRIQNADTKKFKKAKSYILRKLGKRDSNLKNRTNRLWQEIVIKRKHYDMKKLVKKAIKKITKEKLLRFFDKMVNTKLKKLSIQEFSQKVKEIPKALPKIRGYKAKLIDQNNMDLLRKKGKFIL